MHRRRFCCLICLITGVVCVLHFIIRGQIFSKSVKVNNVVEYHHITFGHLQWHCPNVQRSNKSHSRPNKLILFYTTIFGRVPVFNRKNVHCCTDFECEVTADKSKVLQSDAVVFHGRDLPAADQMPKQRTSKQRWIFYTLENPFNSYIIPQQYNRLFNWTMTYEQQADIFLPYGSYRRLNKPIKGEPQKSYAGSKDKFSVYVNSNCRTPVPLRENYIRKLSKFMKLDIYGKCGGIFGKIMCPPDNDACIKLLRRYKFYISFENARCEDYITEKYWAFPLWVDSVPVVYDNNKMYQRLAIPGSYIDASEFEDVESLSKYLKYLDANDTAYNQYFSWKNIYQKIDLEPWPCRVCQMLHNELLLPHTYNNFNEFLDPKHKCQMSLPTF